MLLTQSSNNSRASYLPRVAGEDEGGGLSVLNDLNVWNGISSSLGFSFFFQLL
jgi:hypothetical protein